MNTLDSFAPSPVPPAVTQPGGDVNGDQGTQPLGSGGCKVGGCKMVCLPQLRRPQRTHDLLALDLVDEKHVAAREFLNSAPGERVVARCGSDRARESAPPRERLVQCPPLLRDGLNQTGVNVDKVR